MRSRRKVPEAFLLRHSLFFRVIKDFKDFKVFKILNDPNRHAFPKPAMHKGTKYAFHGSLFCTETTVVQQFIQINIAIHDIFSKKYLYLRGEILFFKDYINHKE